MVIKWEITVRGLMTSCSATCAFVSPRATRRNTSTSRAVNPSGEVYGDFTESVEDSPEGEDVKGITTDPCATRACAGFMARPSAHAVAKAFSPRRLYTAFTERSYANRS